MTTTREAALEAALKLARNRLQACAIDHPTGSREMAERSEWADEATAALSTPATEPQRYVEGPQFRALKTCKGCAHFKSEYWREPSGDGETYDSGTSADCLKAGRSISTYHGSEPAPPDWCPLAARPAPQPAAADGRAMKLVINEARFLEAIDRAGDHEVGVGQPAAEHEYPDPLIAEDRYEDDQPAADTRLVASLLDPNAVHLNMLRGTIAMPSVSQIKHIYGDALTPAPSDKIAEAARVPDLDPVQVGEISNYYGGLWIKAADGVPYWSIEDYSGDTWEVCPMPVFAALRALAGKGE